MGLKAQRAGQAWEEYIEWQATSSNIILVKQYPEVKFFTKGVAKIVGEAWVDYLGSYQGKTFTLDTKSTENKSWWKPPKKTIHQLRTMQRVCMDIPAFYLLEWRLYNEAEVFMVSPNLPPSFKCHRMMGDFLILLDEWEGKSESWLPPLLDRIFEVHNGE